ncbi:MAG: potassium/proton antiporter [Gaiellaceae bacterium]
MAELNDFGMLVLVVAGGFSLAVLTSKLSERLPVPAPALFLLAAAITTDVFPELTEHLSIRTVERIGTVALIVILLDGGMHVGWRRFRGSAFPIATLGVLGTFVTAAVVGVFAHAALGFGWTTSFIVGAALAPTDPAVMFSVLGNREVGGRTGTILEAESGVNDPVGIALIIGLLELATHDDASAWIVVTEFSIEMAVGLVVGVAGAALVLPLMQRVSLPNEGLYAIRVLALAGVVYGAAAVLHGSGFLAVFVTGLLIGDARAPYKAEIERFHTALASLAEVVVFVALGLTVDITNVFDDGQWLDGLLLALVLALVARPLVAGLLLLPVRLRLGERLFVMWGGLKGAVPILLAAFVLLAGIEEAERIYTLVFVVVAFSVIVQGSSIPFAAARLGVPMRTLEPEPWDVSIRLRREPGDVRRLVVGPGSRAVGRAIRDLPLGEGTWISMVIRDGRARQARGSYVFEPGDEVLALASGEDEAALRRLFEARR